jgi:hypothetical protein
MKHYKNSQNEIFAYADDGSQDHLIGDKTPLTQQQVDELLEQKKQEQFNSLSYAEKRRAEYPSMYDYLDGVVKGDQSQIDAYIAACQAIKAKYPKP